MRRGTTPSIRITTNADLREAKQIWLTLVDAKKKELTIDKTGMTVGETELTAALTQAETLAFAEGKISVQLRALLADGTAIASNIVSAALADILKDGEINAPD